MEKENFGVPTRKNWPRTRKFDDLSETVLFSDIIVSKQVDRTMNFRFLAVFCTRIVVYKQFLVYHSFTVHLLWRKIDSRLRFWHYLVEKSADSDPKLSKMVKNHCICHVLTFFLAITDQNYQYFRKILLFLIFLGHFYVQMSLITFNFKNK